MTTINFGVAQPLARTLAAASMVVALGCTMVGEDDADDDVPAGDETAGDAGTSGGATSEGSSGVDPKTDDGDTSESGDPSSGSADETGGPVDPPAGDGVGPGSDPRPDADEPGEYLCDGCPEAMIDLADADAGVATIFALDGVVVGHEGRGQFLVVNEIGQFMGGMLPIDPDAGTFAQTVPLFCGESLVKLLFHNATGTSVYVKRVSNSGCLPADVRTSVAWDDTVDYWALHLVRFGGSLNDWAESDCCTDENCSADNSNHDWGVEGDASDNPVMDLEHQIPGGVASIHYPGATDGLTVAVESTYTNGGQTPAGTLYINVGDDPTYVKQIELLQPMHVLIAAEVDGMSSGLTWIDTDYNCSAEWDWWCEADLP